MRNGTEATWSKSRAVMAAAIGVVLAGAWAGVGAESLPKSGTISLHTGYKYSADVVSAADKHVVGRGVATGVTFNDKGSGPLHLGPANCYGAFLAIDGNGRDRGFCAFGDPDGDRIFAEYSGTFGPEGGTGTIVFTSGIGKYAGIQGGGPWKCKMSGNSGELQCTQHLEYRLP